MNQMNQNSENNTSDKKSKEIPRKMESHQVPNQIFENRVMKLEARKVRENRPLEESCVPYSFGEQCLPES